MADRRTNLICTIGPASRSLERMVELIEAGMDIARLHFSYGSQEEQRENIHRLRRASKQVGRGVGILQDLSGSKVRMMEFAEDPVRLDKDSEFTLTTRKVQGDHTRVSISVPELIEVIEPGDRVWLADGALTLRVLDKTRTEIRCRTLTGGRIKAQQAVHLPGKAAPVRVPTSKDRDDVRFGLLHGVDWIALSYATSAGEVEELRRLLREENSRTPIIVKIERREALEELDAMIRAADAVMVARGDLGLEIPVEEIALVQKEIIARANEARKPVITATEMLTSMMDRPRPTRADVSDITNAILDGSDAVMLSGETAVGNHPAEAVRVMHRVAQLTDARIADRTREARLVRVWKS